MNKNKLLLLISSLGVFGLLAAAAIGENFLKDWRKVQGEAQNADGPIPVHLRQVVNPGLRTADRCVSCHVTMAPGEQEVTGGPLMKKHPPVVHDPTLYGCTICHGGQGAATEREDAHGTVHFWPEPMLPAGMSQAGCGSCHATPGIPSRDQLAAAQAAFERLDCRACHRVDGKGGTIRPDGGGMEGPDLSRAGISGFDANWPDKHVAKAEAAQNGPWKTSFSPVSADEVAAVNQYLATRTGAPKLVEAKATFFSYGCLGCHQVSGVGGDDGPDLTRAGQKDPGQVDLSHTPEKQGIANWVAEHFRAPGALVAGSKMPAVAAPERDIQQLTMFVMSLRRRALPDAYLPKDRVEVSRFGKREFATDGATLYGAFCAGCHGSDGHGRTTGEETFPAIANAEFQAIATDKYLIETIQKGRPGRRMPGWKKDGGLRSEEVAAIAAHLRTLSGASPRGEEDPWKARAANENGQAIYAGSCAGCHGAKGEGKRGPSLANRVFQEFASDAFLRDTIAKGRSGTIMPPFSQSSTAHRTLSDSDIEATVVYVRSLQEKK